MSETVRLTIDDRPVEVEAGQTVLEAARKLGIDIPTLCHLEKCGPLTSCLACVVKVKANGVDKVVPSCATVAQPGMMVESESQDVHEARRTAMELLLSDHVGDCLSPCHRLCPLGLNIPSVLRHVQADDMTAAIATMQDALPLPAVISRLCHAPCENGCRRNMVDQPVAIREVERLVAEQTMQSRTPLARTAPTGKSVVIVGSGPTGLAAAFSLAREGYACSVVDRNSNPGGSLRKLDENALSAKLLDAELDRLKTLGIDFRLEMGLGQTLTIEGLLRGFDAVLLAPGKLSKAEAATFELETTASGLKINPDTFQTSAERVFAAGSAVKPIKQIVRAMAEGVTAAQCIHTSLTARSASRKSKPFSSIMGRLDKEEVAQFLKHANPAARCQPSGANKTYTSEEAALEAARCVHCDCRAAGDCKLQHYAAVYQADPGRFRDQRRPFEQHLQHAGVIYEPGKCIRCGICVKLTELNQEPLGLTYIGRGFDVQVAAPMNQTVATGLQQTATECIESCPTGALVARKHPPRNV